jgi:serine/threonine protein kinase
MPVPVTNREFLDIVRQSGVLSEDQLQKHLSTLDAANAVPTEPERLASALVSDRLLTPFQAERFLQGKWRHFLIGKYKVLDCLGSGGMCSVYLCEHRQMNRQVAIKVLPTSQARDPAALGRFYREARAVAALNHPNIIRAYDIDQDEGIHFLVMEYVEGTTLQDLVKRSGPLEISRAAEHIGQAAVGLQHAHEQGLVHRDIKPGNLLLDRSGVIKILDLGLARFFNEESDILTREHNEVVLGTADYLAPEQALDSHAVDHRADLYSLGMTFYYLLAGKSPLGEGTVAQKLIWHQCRQPPPLREERPEVPAGLAAVVAKMMAKEPEQRFQNGAELLEALSPWLPVDALRLSPPTGARSSEFTLPKEECTVDSTAASSTTVADVPVARETGKQASISDTQRRRAWQMGRRIALAAGAALGLAGLLVLVALSRTGPESTTKPAARWTGQFTTRPNAVVSDFGLLAAWKFDEGRGNVASDSSKNAQHAVLHKVAWSRGKSGSAIYLDGQQAYVNYGEDARFNFGTDSPFTFAGWFKTTANYGPVVSQRPKESAPAVLDIAVGFAGVSDQPGRLMAMVRDDNHADAHAHVAGPVVNDGNWHHFALVRLGNTVTLYVDGAPQGSDTNEAAGGPITTELRVFGSERKWVAENAFDLEKRFLLGWLDEMRIYDRALSNDEISKLFKSAGP